MDMVMHRIQLFSLKRQQRLNVPFNLPPVVGQTFITGLIVTPILLKQTKAVLMMMKMKKMKMKTKKMMRMMKTMRRTTMPRKRQASRTTSSP